MATKAATSTRTELGPSLRRETAYRTSIPSSATSTLATMIAVGPALSALLAVTI